MQNELIPTAIERSTIDFKDLSTQITATTSPVVTSKDQSAPDLLRKLDPKVADVLETLSKEVSSSGLFDDTTTEESPLGPDKISQLVKDLEKKLAAKELARADLTTQARILEKTVRWAIPLNKDLGVRWTILPTHLTTLKVLQ